jgi:hypothetical protein
MRQQSKEHPNLGSVYTWLEKVIPPSKAKPVERDPFLPAIVYTVEYKMSDSDYGLYSELQSKVFGLVSESTSFGQLPAKIESEELVANKMKELGIEPGTDLLETLKQHVKKHHLGWTFDLARSPWNGLWGRLPALGGL